MRERNNTDYAIELSNSLNGGEHAWYGVADYPDRAPVGSSPHVAV
jgi:hypothetical protein